ncbi:MAG: DHH family phosphoesterase [Candidatus Aenigmarchaeota archaeon]|nr:DHH family phosphoesterase [Candidatus Aenigmarchaeota archaeon]
MLDKVEALVLKANNTAEVIKPFSGEVRVVSHHDCDGICSGAIIAKALLRDGKRFRLSFVRQLTADVVEKLSREGNRLTIFADMGSGQLDAIQSRLMKSGEVVVVLDHHQPQGEVLKDRLHQINTYAMGMDGNVSGSGIAYLLARAMSPDNKDLSELGVVGAIGDSQTDSIGPDWGLFGLNKEILKDAVSTGRISVERGLRIWGKTTRPIHKALEFSMDPYIPGVSGSESGAVHFLQELGIPLKNGNEWRTLSDLSDEEARRLSSGIIKERMKGSHENPDWIFGDVYTLAGKGDYSDANEFATILNAAGKQDMGYLGVELCLNSQSAFGEVQDMLDSYRREIGRALDAVCRNGDGRIEKRTTPFANYIIAGSAISEHVISNVTSILSRSDAMPELPVFSFVDAENSMTKISARLPDSMSGSINLKDVVAEAAKSAGGEGGGHGSAAGASIPRGAEQMFINSIETILTNLGKGENTDGRGSEAESQTRRFAKIASGACDGGSEAGKGREAEGRGERAEAGSEAGAEGRVKVSKAVERQGLVRYISA